MKLCKSIALMEGLQCFKLLQFLKFLSMNVCYIHDMFLKNMEHKIYLRFLNFLFDLILIGLFYFSVLQVYKPHLFYLGKMQHCQLQFTNALFVL